jgi:hypothetical protein
MKLLALLFIFSYQAFADDNDISHRPKSFTYKAGTAVFVDFEEATYDITYDLIAKKAEVVAKMRMHVVEEGAPIFDLIQNPTSVTIDGLEVQTTAIKTPANETTVRVIEKSLPLGAYSLEIRVPLTTLVEFTDNGVKNAFWVTDLEDRFYLERYLPVNLEYDRMKMTFNVEFKGLKTKQHIFANGEVSWINASKAKIEFPEYFTVNSLYFHTTPVGSVELLESTYQSIDGRQIPVAIYMAKSMSASSTLNTFKTDIQRIMSELEKDYGPFRHHNITVYNASLAHMGLGGMEYAGATVTNRSALAHELFHSYFARGVTPANGNAGWIDEALASWRDNGYNRSGSFSGTSSMASRPYYTRKTDTAAYSFGARFMAFLDGKFSSKGGLKPFMNKLLEKKLFTPIFTEDFIAEMEGFYGEKVEDLFKAHVYKKSLSEKSKGETHPIHQKMGLKELQQIL